MSRWSRGGWVPAIVLLVCATHAMAQQTIEPKTLLRTAQTLAEKSHYLEALDLLNEARDMLESSGQTQSREFGDVLYALAQTKIRGRIHQNFPAYYVKSALKEVQAANSLRDRLASIPPQQLAEGYFLEGYIHKKFFLRRDQARACFERAAAIDPGNVPVRRELSELEAGKETK